MKPQHVNCSEAVSIHKDVRSMRSVAIHLATFPLTDEPLDEPVVKLAEERKKMGLGEEEFVTLRHGALIVTAGGADLNSPKVLG